jgi:hypothetical protein
MRLECLLLRGPTFVRLRLTARRLRRLALRGPTFVRLRLTARRLRRLAGVALLAGISGCAGPKPVLYPNDHLHSVGQEVAKEDITDCMDGATAAIGRARQGQAIGEAATGSATAAAAGAAGGAVVGRAGRWAAIGAAAGAVRGFMRGFFRSRQPDAAYRGYVNRCLRDLGYDPVGWR